MVRDSETLFTSQGSLIQADFNPCIWFLLLEITGQISWLNKKKQNTVYQPLFCFKWNRGSKQFSDTIKQSTT